MLHVGLDLGRKRIEVCLISDQGELVDRFAAIPDHDGLHGLARRVAVYGEPVRAVVESGSTRACRPSASTSAARSARNLRRCALPHGPMGTR